jgi:hypothetical protein
VADRVCLYALVAGRAASLRMTGIGGERLRAVDMAGIEAVVGVQRGVPRATTTAMARYDRVERELMVVYASVLPARFGTCAPTVDELAASVRDRRASIRRSLRLVRQRVQMTVRVFTAGSDRGQTGVRPGSEYEYGATQGTQYLQRRMEEMQIPGAQPLRDAVARWVRAERTEPHTQGRLAGSLYHLIPRGAVSAYRRALERAATAAQLTTVISGPWPAYAFAEITA